MRVGVIGLGQMGSAIADNLIVAGHDVTVWNRSRDKVDRLSQRGAKPAGTPVEAARGDAVLTIVADDRALTEIVWGEGGILDAPAVHISMSTVSTALTDRLSAANPDRFVSAPVFGRPPAAQAAKLFILAAGPTALVDHCMPLFDAIGQRTFRIGERPSAANIVKLCGNFSIMAAVEAMAEGMAMAERNGVDPAIVVEVLGSTLYPGAAYANYSRILVEKRYRPAGFPATLGLKDMNLVAEAAAAVNVPMPLLGVVREHFQSLIAQGDGDIDWAGIAVAVRRRAGLE